MGGSIAKPPRNLPDPVEWRIGSSTALQVRAPQNRCRSGRSGLPSSPDGGGIAGWRRLEASAALTPRRRR
jgi:hypothetical protein